MRRVFFVVLAMYLLAFSDAASAAPALAKQAQVEQSRAKQAEATKTSGAFGAELLCPQTAGIGEPFLVRLRLARPASSARLEFLGRGAPLVLRKSGAGQEAAALLGADVLNARPGRQTVRVRLVGAQGGKGGAKAESVTASIELVHVKRPTESLTLDPSMVNPPASELPRIAAERAQSQETLGRAGEERLWSLPFARPVPGEVSSIYGIGRVLNGQPRAPHRGLDLEAATGEPVAAAADGVVALVGGFYYAGNCVYLDHGQGLYTMYFHLSEARVAKGQQVARGEVLGLAGATGRSTRSHLHFGVSAMGRLVDPAPLFLYGAFP